MSHPEWLAWWIQWNTGSQTSSKVCFKSTILLSWDQTHTTPFLALLYPLAPRVRHPHENTYSPASLELSHPAFTPYMCLWHLWSVLKWMNTGSKIDRNKNMNVLERVVSNFMLSWVETAPKILQLLLFLDNTDCFFLVAEVVRLGNTKGPWNSNTLPWEWQWLRFKEYSMMGDDVMSSELCCRPDFCWDQNILTMIIYISYPFLEGSRGGQGLSRIAVHSPPKAVPCTECRANESYFVQMCKEDFPMREKNVCHSTGLN